MMPRWNGGRRLSRDRTGSGPQLGKPGSRVGGRRVLTGCDLLLEENTPNRDIQPCLALESILFEQSAPNDHFLDFGGTFADQQHRRLAVETLDLVLLGETVAAVDPEGVL